MSTRIQRFLVFPSDNVHSEPAWSSFSDGIEQQRNSFNITTTTATLIAYSVVTGGHGHQALSRSLATGPIRQHGEAGDAAEKK